MTTDAERMTRLETVYEQVERRLDSIDRRLDGMDRRLEGMENRITTLMVATLAGWAVIAGAIIGAGFI